MNGTANALNDLFYEGVEAGQTQLAQRIRILIYKFAPELFELLDFNDDVIFLDPYLFSYFVDPSPLVKLEQILFGYIPVDSRPKEIPVYADQCGIVELPHIGYLRTGVKNKELQLIWKKREEHCTLQDGDTLVEYVQESPTFVENTGIEVCRYNHPLLQKFFINNSKETVDVDVEQITKLHRNHLSKAFRIIQCLLPNYYENILKVTRRIVIYSGHLPFSFATLAAHGIVFLNASEEDDEVFFIEDLIHQCGHVIFSAYTLDPGEVLQINPHMPFKQLTGDERDNRDVYSTLHGVFTETWMNLGLDLCYESCYFSNRQRHEILGRFALILTRFGCDLRSLSSLNIFTEKGQLLLMWFFRVYHEIVNNRYKLLSQLDISTQSYCFNYKNFLLSNPLPEKCLHNEDSQT